MRVCFGLDVVVDGVGLEAAEETLCLVIDLFIHKKNVLIQPNHFASFLYPRSYDHGHVAISIAFDKKFGMTYSMYGICQENFLGGASAHFAHLNIPLCIKQQNFQGLKYTISIVNFLVTLLSLTFNTFSSQAVLAPPLLAS